MHMLSFKNKFSDLSSLERGISIYTWIQQKYKKTWEKLNIEHRQRFQRRKKKKRKYHEEKYFTFANVKTALKIN